MFTLILGENFPIIGISESWLTDINDPLIKIPGYVIEGFCRQNTERGGGVELYIKEEYTSTYKIRDDLCVNTSGFESCFIEIQK